MTGVSCNGNNVKWEFRLPASPLLAGLSAANGVVYFQSPFEEPISSPGNPEIWALYALDIETGAVLNRIAFTGKRALNSPAISRGRVYAGFGNFLAHGVSTPNLAGGLMCLGLPDDD